MTEITHEQARLNQLAGHIESLLDEIEILEIEKDKLENNQEDLSRVDSLLKQLEGQLNNAPLV